MRVGPGKGQVYAHLDRFVGGMGKIQTRKCTDEGACRYRDEQRATRQHETDLPDGVPYPRKCHAALGGAASFFKRVSPTPGRAPSPRPRGEGWGEGHSTRTKRWL